MEITACYSEGCTPPSRGHRYVAADQRSLKALALSPVCRLQGHTLKKSQLVV